MSKSVCTDIDRNMHTQSVFFGQKMQKNRQKDNRQGQR